MGVQKIKNYHITPKTGRVSMVFTKEQGKTLKKLGIDLEMTEDETIVFGIEMLEKIVNGVDISGLSKEELKKHLLSIQFKAPETKPADNVKDADNV